MSDDRPTVYFDPDTLDGVWIYRASGTGECVRALVASAMDYDEVRSAETREMLARTAKEGDIHEAAMRKALEAEGHVFRDEAGAQIEVLVPVVKNTIYIRGHIDGYIMEGPRLRDGLPAIWEAKSVSANQFKSWMAKGKDGVPKRFANHPRKAAQITCYRRAFPEADTLYQVKRRDDGTVDTHIIPAGEDPMPWKDIRNKILMAETYRRQGALPSCDIPNRWGCDFFYLHEEEVLPDDPVPEEQMEALGALAQRYVDLRAIERQGEDAAKERKSFTDEMVEIVGDHPYIDTGDFKVSVVSYDKAYTDWNAVQAEATRPIPELLDEYGSFEGLIAAHTESRKVTYPKVTKKES